jgi:hypothetical protein
VSDDEGDKVLCFLREIPRKGKLLAALAVFNRQETMCGVCSSVATPPPFVSFFCSLHFPPFVLTFAMGPARLHFSTIRKPGKTNFFTKEISQLKKKKKKKG